MEDQNEFRSIRGDGFYADIDNDNNLKPRNRAYYFGDMRFYEDIGIRCIENFHIDNGRRGACWCNANDYPYILRSAWKSFGFDTPESHTGFRCVQN